MSSRLARGFDASDDVDKGPDRREPIQRLHHSPHIERDVFVDDDVSESRQPFELLHELGRKTFVVQQAPDGPDIVLESIAPTRRELTRDAESSPSAT
jgi:hypothetical protein